MQRTPSAASFRLRASHTSHQVSTVQQACHIHNAASSGFNRRRCCKKCNHPTCATHADARLHAAVDACQPTAVVRPQQTRVGSCHKRTGRMLAQHSIPHTCMLPGCCHLLTAQIPCMSVCCPAQPRCCCLGSTPGLLRPWTQPATKTTQCGQDIASLVPAAWCNRL
jgi:hypothetical protein